MLGACSAVIKRHIPAREVWVGEALAMLFNKAEQNWARGALGGELSEQKGVGQVA